MSKSPAERSTHHSSLITHYSLVLYFLRLGALGFGGPIALAGAMQRDLVDERGWRLAAPFRSAL